VLAGRCGAATTVPCAQAATRSGGGGLGGASRGDATSRRRGARQRAGRCGVRWGIVWESNECGRRMRISCLSFFSTGTGIVPSP
jgi:hypothetical protein